ncbi:hypothetical protein CC1G_14410 [Coprinopsis cinerea okayama7|uniref:Peptidase C14 caspase domain-containing protein n=1 Tax=Coprinopsis cinerea (strain Okayama-7 / 130 / ATCC MYA-4618 / FGSC 9003) TaxID=240176 RepID=D6RMA6_COPC7|nr:hypothetical protein CC1G_14410 [Coprinopsis cinerea okayama7\|eukprot:XP_002911413.1 hypothetical protein CC1G_14410 [Coprinopsis cinerea okayama7\
MFTIIIGINKYRPECGFKELHGAVNDAREVYKFLVAELGVPKEQIIFLTDEQASRDNIRKAFRRLRDDKRVERDDPILVYFAGHGAEIVCTSGARIQAIVPQDYKCDGPNPVPPVLDLDLAAYLNSLSGKHGNNITVIFDCCHSGSGTRGAESGGDPLAQVRGGEVLHGLPFDFVQGDTTEASRGMSIAKGFTDRDTRSHVLLAACSARHSWHLRLLRRVSLGQLSYSRVLSHMEPIINQNPQCEGFYRDRILFTTSETASSQEPWYIAEKLGDLGGYLLQVGSAGQGFTHETKFLVFESEEAVVARQPLTVMTPGKIDAFQATLEQLPGDPITLSLPMLYAIPQVSESRKLLLHVPTDDGCRPILECFAKDLGCVPEGHCLVDLVSATESDQVQMGVHAEADGCLVFDILDARLTRHGITHLPHTLRPVPNLVDQVFPVKLKEVLRAAAHFLYHLNHTQENNYIPDRISIRFMRLAESSTQFDEEGKAILEPFDENLVNEEGIIDFSPEVERVYGFELENGTPWGLFFHCLYFNSMDLSITSFTSAGNNNNHPYDLDDMLGKKGSGNSVAGIGYGPLGLAPIQPNFDEKEKVLTAGFFKFYFSTKPIDLSHIPCPSPFEGGRGMDKAVRKVPHVWGTLEIPVIQRRTCAHN